MLTKAETDTLKEIYYNPQTGFSSAKDLSRRSGIDLKKVKNWLSNQETDQKFKKTKSDKVNVYIIFSALQEFQLDTMFLGKTKYMVAIDSFSRKASIQKLGNTVNSRNSREAFKKVISELGVPETVYVDRGTEFKKDFFEFVEKNNIQLIEARKKAWKSERLIQTVRLRYGKASDVFGKKDKTKLLKEVVEGYNSSVHSQLNGQTPNEVHQKVFDRELVENQLQNRSKIKLKKLQKGDLVRKFIKKGTFNKSNEPNWSEAIYEVVEIKNGKYRLEGGKTYYQRSELQKVILVEKEDKKPEIEYIENNEKPFVRATIKTRSKTKKN